MPAEAQPALSTRETALRYTADMRTADVLTHGLFLALTSACFTCGDSKGDESGVESTGLPENEYCSNPAYPGDASTMNSCGCGLSAVSDERNPFYVDCISETCANNPDACPPAGARATCLWDGDITTSPGSVCAQPCSDEQPCSPIEGRQATCMPVDTTEGVKGLCVIDCHDVSACPDKMACATGQTNFGSYYCIYDLPS